jgi:hypothetical protein
MPKIDVDPDDYDSDKAHLLRLVMDSFANAPDGQAALEEVRRRLAVLGARDERAKWDARLAEMDARLAALDRLIPRNPDIPEIAEAKEQLRKERQEHLSKRPEVPPEEEWERRLAR